MRHPIIAVAAAGLLGTLLGGSAVLWVTPHQPPTADMREARALRPSVRGERSERPRSTAQPPTVGAEAGAAPPAAAPPAAAGSSSDGREQIAAELSSLRATARAAQKQLGDARRQIAALEKELEHVAPNAEPRTRHEFDLTPEDWRQLATEGTMKYRLPCSGGAASAPTDDVLDELGLAPDDREVLRTAYEHSLERQRNALLPLCATALGNRMDLATVVSVNSCQHIIFSTASARSESDSQAAKTVATYMAGDGPRPSESASLSERAFLVLTEESRHFEDELAEAFGPDEAHRLVFSNRLCFNHSTHRFKAGDKRAP